MTQQNKTTEILTAMGWLLLCHIGLVAIASLFAWLQILSLYLPLMYAVFGIGITQLFYAIPLYLRYKRQRRFSAMKGVVIGAILTVLLNGSCFGLVLWILSSLH